MCGARCCAGQQGRAQCGITGAVHAEKPVQQRHSCDHSRHSSATALRAGLRAGEDLVALPTSLYFLILKPAAAAPPLLTPPPARAELLVQLAPQAQAGQPSKQAPLQLAPPPLRVRPHSGVAAATPSVSQEPQHAQHSRHTQFQLEDGTVVSIPDSPSELWAPTPFSLPVRPCATSHCRCRHCRPCCRRCR